MYEGQPTIPADWLSAFNMISSVGQFFGGFLCSVAVDRIGRRAGLAVGVLISCGGVFGEIFSTARVSFLISKLILGVGLGFYLTIGPLYSSEVCISMLSFIIEILWTDEAFEGFPCRSSRYHHGRYQPGHRYGAIAVECSHQRVW